ncbi:MAG: alkaline phosphatase D family protein, partial [Myxococcales bacterium]|nr:alkaline phosphatase D family protein [Myxococcales bacterium]
MRHDRFAFQLGWRAIGALTVVTLVGCGAGTPSTNNKTKPHAERAALSEPPPAPRSERHIDLGPAAFDVTASTAIVWARGADVGTLHVELRAPDGTITSGTAELSDAHDRTGAVPFTGLRAATPYTVTAWVAEDARPIDAERDRWGTRAQFRTAPAPETAAALRFVWSADLGGQTYCRDATLGYPIFHRMAAAKPAFFLALGDMIYADDVCPATSKLGNAQVAGEFMPATDLEGFRAHWRYNRADAGFASFLRETPSIVTWDDHEIVNNAAPDADTPRTTGTDGAPPVHLFGPALEAFREYNPMGPLPGGGSPIYRSIRWGRHAEVFVLDLRSYRGSNTAVDGPSKSMLGSEQYAWLEQAVRRSDATWKIIASSVPMALPTGNAKEHDAWANGSTNLGFETELTRILYMLRDAGARNVLWLAADVHIAAGYKYTPFPTTPDFHVYEAIAGPLSAALGIRWRLDKTFHPEELYYSAPSSKPTSYDAARPWFNFGTVEIDAAGALTVTTTADDG